MRYNWQQEDWPDFRYDLSGMDGLFLIWAEKTGRLNGMMSALPDSLQTDAMVDLMVAEAMKTSEIEGDYISRHDVRSSICKELGLTPYSEKISDARAQGVGRLMVEVRRTFHESLTDTTLLHWHRVLLAAQYAFNPEMLGQWRTHTDAMQVVSGSPGNITVHFEAPPSSRVPEEMARFITWFNRTAPGGSEEIRPAPVRAAIAHLYFESIHPFEDGNGRIGRAIAEKALFQGMNAVAVLSLSQTIEADKKRYYDALETAQKFNDITPWIHYFVSIILAAQIQAEDHIRFIVRKAGFFDRFKPVLNERQLKVIRRMLEEGPSGFEGGINARKYGAITGASKATATRDLQHLLEINALIQTGGGRSTRYDLNLEEKPGHSLF